MLPAILWALVLAAKVGANVVTYCPDLKPQQGIDLDQLQGTWYVVQASIHRYNYTLSETDLSCAVFFIERTDSNSLGLWWRQDSSLEDVKYDITLMDAESPGLWKAQSSVMGSPPEVIQVMKAVGDHVVLTFCDRAYNIFTAILGRKNHLKKKQIQAINVMLQRRGLPIISAKVMTHYACSRNKLWKQGAPRTGQRSSGNNEITPAAALIAAALFANRAA